MNIKSEYLIHWTGKDIGTSDSLTSAQRDQYIMRLKNTIKTGLWMMPYSGELVGRGGVGITTFSEITCFTENRSNYYKTHASKYGLMGFGFSRQWVLDRDGLPVFYFKNDPSDLHVRHLYNLWMALQALQDQQPYREFSLLMDYTKPMSTLGTSDFSFLEESEWRIAWNSGQSANFSPHQPTPPAYHVRFLPTDLKLLILPDNTSRKMALADPEISGFIQSGNSETLVISLEELSKL